METAPAHSLKKGCGIHFSSQPYVHVGITCGAEKKDPKAQVAVKLDSLGGGTQAREVF